MCQGLDIAGLPRWAERKGKRQTTAKSYRIQGDHLSQLTLIFGASPSYALSVGVVKVGGVTFRCSSDLSVGDANIGYLSTDEPYRYHVGRIETIIKFSTHKSENTVFLVRQHKPLPKGFSTELWDAMEHPALGLRLVSIDTEKNTVMVPLKNVIGHVAVNRVRTEHVVALLTIQLSKVRLSTSLKPLY